MPCDSLNPATTPPPNGGPDTIAPAAPNGLRGVGNAVSGNTLTWNGNLESDLAGYDVYSASSQNGTYTKLNGGGLLVQPSYADAAATSGATTWYHVYALDTSGNRSPFSEVSVVRPNVTITPPAAPVGVVATGTPSGITVTWTANVETNIAGYHVSRGTAVGGPFTPIGPALFPLPQYGDSTATAGVTFYYQVFARNTSNLDSAASAVVHATGVDVIPPAVPVGVAAAGGVSNAVITWTANTDADLAGYNVYSSPTATGVFTKINIALITAGTQTYTDSTIVAGQTLYYAVTAVDTSNNESAKSTVVNATRTPSGTTALPIVYNGGESPALVIASLWLTSVANGRQQRNCRYAWDAGDPGSDYNQITDSSPLFHHFYAAPGTYTMTCTRVDPDLNVVHYSVNVTVSASTRTQIYVDANNGNDANNGSQSAPLQTIAGLLPKIQRANVEVLFARGQQHNLTGANGQSLPATYTNVLYRDYGAATLPKPIVYVLMPTTSGPLTGGKNAINFSDSASHVRFLNIRWDSNAVPGSYTGGGVKTFHVDPSIGRPRGRGLAMVNCDLGNLEHGFYADGVTNFWLLQRVLQVSANIPNHFVWIGSTGGGMSTYAGMHGCVQVQVSEENGTRAAGDGMQYFHAYDCTFGKTINSKAVIDLRHCLNFVLSNCRMTGAAVGLSPRTNLDIVQNGVYENCLLTKGAHFTFSAPNIQDIDFKNLIFDMGTDPSPCVVIATGQGGFEPSINGHSYGEFLKNCRWFHCTFKLAGASSKVFAISIGPLRDNTDAIVGKNYFTGFWFKNCLTVGPITKKSGGAVVNVYNDPLFGKLSGFTTFSGNCHPVADFNAVTHPTTLPTDVTHFIGAPVTNSAFGKLPPVSDEHYLALTLDTSYRASGAPSVALDPVGRYDYDGNLRTITNGKVTVGAKQ